MWCIPEASASYVAAMEDVLAVYERPYSEKQPVVCLDETNRQLIGEIQTPRPAAPGQPAVCDYEYVRNGIADLFMMFEPLAGRREVKATETRTKKDFAHCLKELAETHYPDAEKIVVVMDNLNIERLLQNFSFATVTVKKCSFAARRAKNCKSLCKSNRLLQQALHTLSSLYDVYPPNRRGVCMNALKSIIPPSMPRG
jgi:hypothetical protein